ncbi:acetyl-CoA synthetase-like protein [Atractiella rhizophila]|nr:acetyl-CoA synthetase-like protein [Atractiella rhizophila]
MASLSTPTIEPSQPYPYAVLDKHARESPSHPALYYVSTNRKAIQKISYAELSERTERAAIVFGEQLKVGKGERVLVQLPRGVAWFEVVLGLLRIGGIPIPCTTLLSSKELEYRAQAAKCTTFVGSASAVTKFLQVKESCPLVRNVVFVAGDPDLEPRDTIPQDSLRKLIIWEHAMANIPQHKKWGGARPEMSDTSIIYFTSGTTGKPKRVIHNHHHPFAHRITGEWYNLGDNALIWNIGDLGWAKAGYSTFGSLYFKATIFIFSPPAPSAFSAELTLSLLHEHPITNICFPPTVYRSLTTTAAVEQLRRCPPKALRWCNGAGEPLNPEVIKIWEQHTGLIVREAFGQTETTALVGNFPKVNVRMGSMGIAAAGLDVQVLDTAGKVLGRGPQNVGFICVEVARSNVKEIGVITLGYEGENGELMNTYIESGDGKQWYSTGDKAWRDEDGYFWFIGRDDDIISSAGYRIGPFDVESTLKEHPAVVESAAVASPDRERGSIVKAFIILSQEFKAKLISGEITESGLKQQLTEFSRPLLTYKYPREIEFVDSLPLTVSGKIRRVELRKLEEMRKGTKGKL